MYLLHKKTVRILYNPNCFKYLYVSKIHFKHLVFGPTCIIVKHFFLIDKFKFIEDLETPSQTLWAMNRKDRCGGVSRFAKQISDHEKAQAKLLSKRNYHCVFRGKYEFISLIKGWIFQKFNQIKLSLSGVKGSWPLSVAPRLGRAELLVLLVTKEHLPKVKLWKIII